MKVHQDSGINLFPTVSPTVKSGREALDKAIESAQNITPKIREEIDAQPNDLLH